MKAYNKTIVLGNLGRDPEMRYTPNGKAVCNFSIASTDSFTRDGEKQGVTTWFRCTAWDKFAETCNNILKKGSQVLVEGRVSVSAYEKDGEPRASLELTVRDLIVVKWPKEEEESSTGEDSIPF